MFDSLFYCETLFTMAMVFVKLTFLLIVFELTTTNDCNLSNTKLKKMVKQYKKKCFNRGKTSPAITIYPLIIAGCL